MSPTLNGSSAIRRFERSDAIEIRDEITFDFYTGLPHMDVMCREYSTFTGLLGIEGRNVTVFMIVEGD